MQACVNVYSEVAMLVASLQQDQCMLSAQPLVVQRLLLTWVNIMHQL